MIRLVLAPYESIYFPTSGGSILAQSLVLSAAQGFSRVFYDPAAPPIGPDGPVDSGWMVPIRGTGFSMYSGGVDPGATRRVQLSDGVTLWYGFTGVQPGDKLPPSTNPAYTGFRSGNPVILSCDPLPAGAIIQAGGLFRIVAPRSSSTWSPP